jgi:serine/threonine protein kinase
MTKVKPIRSFQPPDFVAELIAFGAYGRLFRLRDNPSRVFKCCERDNPEAVETIARERDILEFLGAHPFLIQLHWTNLEGLCFEYYPLGSLRNYYKQSLSLPPTATRGLWCEQVADGIAFIHSKGIVHNDIGARNILISLTMDIKICDFGSSTKVGVDVLSVPETRYSRYRRGSPRASFLDDLFSVGSLFFEILEGRQPYDEIESDEVENRIESSIFPPLDALEPDYFAAIIGKCWKIQYSSVEDLQVDLNSGSDPTSKGVILGQDLKRRY